MRKKYSEEELINKIRRLYIENGKPLTQTRFEQCEYTPISTLIRIFGSLKEACKKAGVPYGKEIKRKHGNITNRLGEKLIDKKGQISIIVKYNQASDIVIEFQDEYKCKVHTNYSNWKKGSVTNPYFKSVYGIGCIGNASAKINGVKQLPYAIWHAMMRRCYHECYENKHTYLDVTVCDEWLCYENFKKWFDTNYYRVNDEMMSLDKDILYKGNKIYCPEKCIFAPQRINAFFINNPINTLSSSIIYKRKDGYRVLYNYEKNTYELGIAHNIQEAIDMYVSKKNDLTKEIANQYKAYIPERLYKAMCGYKWEITILDDFEILD